MHHHAFMHSCIVPISNLLFIARACMLSDFILIFFVSDNYLYCLLLSLTNSTCISLTNQFHILLMLYPLCGHAATVYMYAYSYQLLCLLIAWFLRLVIFSECDCVRHKRVHLARVLAQIWRALPMPTLRRSSSGSGVGFLTEQPGSVLLRLSRVPLDDFIPERQIPRLIQDGSWVISFLQFV